MRESVNTLNELNKIDILQLFKTLFSFIVRQILARAYQEHDYYIKH